MSEDLVTIEATGGGEQGVALGVMVLLVGAALVLAGRSAAPAAEAAVPAYLHEIESGADHVDSATLAADLMRRRDGLLVVDVRPADEYAAFHLPGAHNLSVPLLLGAEGHALLAAASATVLYSNGPAHPAQAWVELRRRGVRAVHVLDGGLVQFETDVLTPASLRGPATAEQSAAERTALQLRRAFFLGDGHAPASGWATDPEVLATPTVVSPDWLERRLDRVAVIDARSSADDFAVLHVPGAAHVPSNSLRGKHGDRSLFLLPPAELARRLGAAGVGADSQVVVYAGDKMQDATLVAVALMRLGHRALAILDGGILAWAAGRRPLLAAADDRAPAPREYPLGNGDPTLAIALDELAPKVAARAIRVLDVRPRAFFTGDKSSEARPGHIPGAAHRAYDSDLLASDDALLLRPPAELRAAYAGLGLRPDDEIAVSCRTGHQASLGYFVLRHLLGYHNVRWYNGSWTEWAEHAELPAETGGGDS